MNGTGRRSSVRAGVSGAAASERCAWMSRVMDADEATTKIRGRVAGAAGVRKGGSREQCFLR